MAECSEIEAGGEVRTIKDTTARQGVTTNATAIAEINKKIPASASTSNQMATTSDLASKMDKPPTSPSASVISTFTGQYINSGSPITWQSDRQGFIKIHYANVGAGYSIGLSINGVEVDGVSNLSAESDHGTLIGFVYAGQTVAVTSDASNNKIQVLTATIQNF